jgi:hypothetical protein
MNTSDVIDATEQLVQRELRASAPALPRPEPPRGIYLQLYRGAIRGPTREAKRAQLAEYCDRIDVMGLPGVVFHGFCEDLAGAWDGLAKLAADRGLLALASWGLDSRDLSAARKGELVGDVLARPTCAGGLLDAEGQWDSDLGAADDMDEAGALALAAAIQKRAPGAWVGDQPWFAIEAHGDLRKTANRPEAGGVFRGFPVDEFASVCTWGRYRQAYIYRALGALYAPTFARMDREWSSITPALRAAGLERPLRVTLQAYGWLLHEQVDAIINRGVAANASVILWCDPWPDAVALRAIAAATWLEHEGYARPGVAARAAVRAAQAEFNRRGARLTVDGWWGEATHRAAGLS